MLEYSNQDEYTGLSRKVYNNDNSTSQKFQHSFIYLSFIFIPKTVVCLIKRFGIIEKKIIKSTDHVKNALILYDIPRT